MPPVNYHALVNVTDIGAFPAAAQAIFAAGGAGFWSAHVMVLNQSNTDAIEYSFNGTDVHGRLNPNEPNEGIDKPHLHADRVWLRVVAGGAGGQPVRVWAWRS